MQVTHQKGYKGMGMGGMAAKWYAANTRKFLDEALAQRERLVGDRRMRQLAMELSTLATADEKTFQGDLTRMTVFVLENLPSHNETVFHYLWKT